MITSNALEAAEIREYDYPEYVDWIPANRWQADVFLSRAQSHLRNRGGDYLDGSIVITKLRLKNQEAWKNG